MRVSQRRESGTAGGTAGVSPESFRSLVLVSEAHARHLSSVSLGTAIRSRHAAHALRAEI
eukprot:4738238-Prymnesium_polylepis.1